MASLTPVRSTAAKLLKTPGKCNGLPFIFCDLNLNNKSKCKLLIFFSCICTLGCFLWLSLGDNEYGYFNCGYFTACPKFIDIGDELNGQSTIVLNERTCRIPMLPIMPSSLKSSWHPKPMDRCKHIRPVIQQSTLNDTASILPNVKDSCCVQEVLRGNDDKHYGLSGCQTFQRGSKLPQDVEAMFITCDGSMNAMANVPRSKAAAKLKYWKSIPAQDRPISVYLFGIDSVSRSHAYRSIPKSLAMMKRLGFADFTRFHSVAPSTLSNFMALLMGMTRPKVRESCCKDWNATFDDCPLIWKQFNASNYVTGYFEDGSQSFNWGRQSGFVKRPVDYYLHPLFLALRNYRIRELGPRTRKNIDCLSRETVPEFLLRHSLRFVQTFSSVPFFGLTWWSNPFHDSFHFLADFDSEFARFVELVGSDKEIRETTMLIYLSDHGDRFSSFSSKSGEGYIERALPPLFIRIPDKLKRSYPAMQESLERNSAQFVTPFDLHHTMLHILSLSNQVVMQTQVNTRPKQSEDFVTTKSGRSSLLVDVPRDRTCTSTNIKLASCVCDVDYDERSNATKGAGIVYEMIEQASLQFAINKLNQKIQSSKYKNVCSMWYARFKDLKYLSVLSQKGNFSEIVLGFVARPGKAQFEARISIGLKEKNYFARLIGFARVSPYEGQSWCVGWTSDSDKEMRELCMCKVQKPPNDTSVFRFWS